MATIITGGTIDKKTGEFVMEYKEVTQEEFIAWVRPLLDAAKILQRANDERKTAQA